MEKVTNIQVKVLISNNKNLLMKKLDKALAWLANHCISLGAPLKKGKFIMLGSVVKTVFIEQPATVSIRFDELGEASVRFV